MQNCQLYQTNPKLSGQIKWNIHINRVEEDLYISNFFISPLSRYINYMYDKDMSLLNTTHRYNVSQFYHKNSGIFFEDEFNKKIFYPNVKSACPIRIDDKNRDKFESDKIHIEQFDMDYKMGVRRTSFKKYGKQFELFCPVWIESLKYKENEEGQVVEKEELYFNFEIYIKNVLLTKKNLVLNREALERFDYHDKFTSYFYNHLNDMGLDNVNSSLGSDLMNINFSTDQYVIHGLNVKTGVLSTISLNNMKKNLLSQERPLMNTDELLINSFKENHVISKQLFNFNFFFNLEDFLNPWEQNIVAETSESDFSIKVFVGRIKTKGNEKEVNLFPLKDFYTNYKYIPRANPNNLTDSDNNIISENVLDYLHDYNDIENLYKNKLNPHICHWSLVDNDKYIFNLYKGFSATGSILDNYNGAPDIGCEIFNPSLFNDRWCNKVNIEDEKMLDSVLERWNSAVIKNHIDENKIIGVNIFENNVWINNVKYEGISHKNYGKVYIYVLQTPQYFVNQHIIENNIRKYGWMYNEQNKIFYDIHTINTNDLFLSICGGTDDIQRFTFKKFYKFIIEIANKTYSAGSKGERISELFKGLYGFMGNLNINHTPPLVYIESKIEPQYNTSLKTVQKLIPGKNIIEFERFKKVDKGVKQAFKRYSGKIKPMFIELGDETYFNELFYVKTLNEKDWNKTAYGDITIMNLPSVGKYPIGSIPASESMNNVPSNLKLDFEDSWYNNNTLMYIPTEFKMNIVREQDPDTGLIPWKELVKIEFTNRFGDRGPYLHSLYDSILVNYDYDKIDDHNDIKYDIKLTLK